MESWSLTRVAQESGRSVEHVRQMCRGLMGESASAVEQGKSVAFSPEMGEALVAAFKVRLLSPALIAQIKDDPAQVRQALQALALLLDPSEAEMAA